MSAASSKRRRAAGRVAQSCTPMPRAWAPCPGKRNAALGMVTPVIPLPVRGDGRAGLQLLDDQLVEPGPHVAGRHAEGVLDRPVARGAVADDANPVDAQQRGPAVLVVVVAVH